jgi:hypothetical protein
MTTSRGSEEAQPMGNANVRIDLDLAICILRREADEIYAVN